MYIVPKLLSLYCALRDLPLSCKNCINIHNVGEAGVSWHVFQNARKTQEFTQKVKNQTKLIHSDSVGRGKLQTIWCMCINSTYLCTNGIIL